VQIHSEPTGPDSLLFRRLEVHRARRFGTVDEFPGELQTETQIIATVKKNTELLLPSLVAEIHAANTAVCLAPATSPFPSFGRRLPVLHRIATTFRQFTQTARVRNRIHHARAGHGVYESGLFATCAPQNYNYRGFRSHEIPLTFRRH